MFDRIFASVLILVVGATLPGCRSHDAGGGAEDDVAIDRGRFGDPYEVVSNFSPADPDLYPVLSGDTLIVRLTYSGGCETHTLDLDSDVRQDTAFVWIRHDARGDACEALIHDELDAVLPSRVLDARVLALLHPQEGPPQILRERR